MRFWLLTSTTYGTWLPGDQRGFVGRVWETRPNDQACTTLRRQHNQPGETYDADIPGLLFASQRFMKGRPVWLTVEHAEVILGQFQVTSDYRGWMLHAASVMANHFHTIVEAPLETSAEDILRDLKSYASRQLNSRFGKPSGGTWWTASGSKRALNRIDRLDRPIRYVLNQHQFLVRYLHSDYGMIEDYLHSTER